MDFAVTAPLAQRGIFKLNCFHGYKPRRRFNLKSFPSREGGNRVPKGYSLRSKVTIDG